MLIFKCVKCFKGDKRVKWGSLDIVIKAFLKGTLFELLSEV